MHPSARLWLTSLVASLGLVALLALEQLVEILVFGGRPRRGLAIRDAVEGAMRVAGFGHHLVAAFFLAASGRAHSLSGGIWTIGLLVAGAGLSVVFAGLGGRVNPLAMGGFIVLFVAHAFRDEIFFYREYGRAAGRPVRDPGNTLGWLLLAVMGLLSAVLVPVWVLVAYMGSTSWLPRWLPFNVRPDPRHTAALRSLIPGDWSVLAIVTVFALPFAIILAVACARLVAAGAPGVMAHGPVVRVLAASVALTLGSGLLGLWLIDVVILMHFVSWFVFTTEKLRRPVPPGRPGSWSLVEWLRGTRPGFWTLHGGISVAVLGLIVFNHHVLRGQPLAWAGFTLSNPFGVLSADAFYYWTIVHVTLSLVPRAIRPSGPSPVVDVPVT